MLALWKKSYDQHRKHIKKKRHNFADKGLSSQSYGFSSSYVWMWELDNKESWALKNLCFWTMVLEKTLESPLAWKEIKPVNAKCNQSWIFIERIMLKQKVLYFGQLLQRTDSFEKTLTLGEPEGRRGDRGWDGKMASQARRTWIWTSSVGQGAAVHRKESDMTEWLKWSELQRPNLSDLLSILQVHISRYKVFRGGYSFIHTVFSLFRLRSESPLEVRLTQMTVVTLSIIININQCQLCIYYDSGICWYEGVHSHHVNYVTQSCPNNSLFSHR